MISGRRFSGLSGVLPFVATWINPPLDRNSITGATRPANGGLFDYTYYATADTASRLAALLGWSAVNHAEAPSPDGWIYADWWWLKIPAAPGAVSIPEVNAGRIAHQIESDPAGFARWLEQFGYSAPAFIADYITPGYTPTPPTYTPPIIPPESLQPPPAPEPPPGTTTPGTTTPPTSTTPTTPGTTTPGTTTPPTSTTPTTPGTTQPWTSTGPTSPLTPAPGSSPAQPAAPAELGLLDRLGDVPWWLWAAAVGAALYIGSRQR